MRIYGNEGRYYVIKGRCRNPRGIADGENTKNTEGIPTRARRKGGRRRFKLEAEYAALLWLVLASRPGDCLRFRSLTWALRKGEIRCKPNSSALPVEPARARIAPLHSSPPFREAMKLAERVLEREAASLREGVGKAVGSCSLTHEFARVLTA